MNGEEQTNGQQTNGRYDPDMFDVRGSLRSVGDATRQHKWLVIFTCLLSLGIVILYVQIWPPIYRVKATIMVEKDADPSRDSFYIGWNMFRKDDAKTEIELMTSGTVLKEVIQNNHLTYDDVYHPFFSHLSYLWQESWLGKQYKALKQQFSHNTDPSALSPEEKDLARTMGDMGAGIAIEPVAESNVGEITVKGPSRRVAQIANSLIDVYLKHRAERHYAEAGDSYEILAKEVTQAQKDFDDIAARRVTFAAEHGVTLNFQKETVQVARLAEMELDIASAKAKAANSAASLAEVEKQLAAEPATRIVASTMALNDVREVAKRKHFDIETQLAIMRDHYREDSPEVQEIKNDLAKVDAIIAGQPEKIESSQSEQLNVVRQGLLERRNTLKSDLEGGRAGLAVMEESASQLRAHLENLPAMQTQMASMDEAYTIAKNALQSLMEKKTQAAVSQASTTAIMPSLRVVDYAMPPSDPWWPQLKYLYPGTLLVGLILGVGLAVLRSYFSGKIQVEHVERGRGAIPLYGRLPVVARSGVSLRPVMVQGRFNAPDDGRSLTLGLKSERERTMNASGTGTPSAETQPEPKKARAASAGAGSSSESTRHDE